MYPILGARHLPCKQDLEILYCPIYRAEVQSRVRFLLLSHIISATSLGARGTPLPVSAPPSTLFYHHLANRSLGGDETHSAAMINAFLVFNGQGQPRLTKFYTQLVRCNYVAHAKAEKQITDSALSYHRTPAFSSA